jgi:hypothetical protein
MAVFGNQLTLPGRSGGLPNLRCIVFDFGLDWTELNSSVIPIDSELVAFERASGCRVDGMVDDDPNETDAEHRHRLWWGVRRPGLVQWVSLCIVLAMVAGLFWLAIHFSKPAGF